ncbi:pyridoxal phosphate (PLP)-dependent transferases superfamily protein [Actinidia rufa]|uniref:Pyridoxal phosphate (PLP)-dependent transferases superfamily protein n=1 Tax=Actinidia rufa TaxID=165716 RepID=A0A7J0ECX2_9ERIC|nr:pyridoxal phosphate (PLP)-dependent transferases superfamily protein [Actinidia rufa]
MQPPCLKKVTPEYYHLSLSNHICLDYIGIGLFSHTQFQNQHSSILPIASSSSPPPECSDFPYFGISHKSANLKSQLLHGGQGSELEFTIKKKIMNFLNISENDYCMVFTANRSSAFKLLAESYPFQASRKLLTVYDYESEAVEAMINASEKRGAQVMSAEFKWPRLRVHSGKLKKMIVRTGKNKKTTGLFMFPLQSRVTGASYSYQWMSMAQENGWHILLDACALGPKDMDSFGLSLIHPDFLVCSFYKVFGENPTGFGCLFVKKSTVPVLEASTSTGIVSLVPANKLFCLPEDSSGTDTELEQASRLGNPICELPITRSFLDPISVQSIRNGRSEHVDASQMHESEATTEQQGPENSSQLVQQGKGKHSTNCSSEIECRGLDHVDLLGLILTSSRSRFLINWLINALMKLQHPNADERIRLVRIYGPRIKFDRGPALAFNVYDWKGERVEPALVQKLADRSNISLSYGSLHHIWFPDKYHEERERVIDKKKNGEKERDGNRRTEANHVTVVTVALGFLANFEDIYKLWAFVAQFLDADFVEKERWRYTALNQKIVEV